MSRMTREAALDEFRRAMHEACQSGAAGFGFGEVGFGVGRSGSSVRRSGSVGRSGSRRSSVGGRKGAAKTVGRSSPSVVDR